MEKYVLDTNLFFNMEPGLNMGKKTEDVVVAVTNAIKKSEVEFYMPPRIMDEFLSFFDNKDQPFLKEFQAQIKVKSPDISSINFPADVFYKMVDDIRGRSYRGLTIAEEEVRNVANLLNEQTTELSKIELEKKSGEVTKKLRERYRNATRNGFLDSLADLDLIVLTRELDAVLVSTDEGVLHWGRVFGVHEMDAPVFGQKLLQILN